MAGRSLSSSGGAGAAFALSLLTWNTYFSPHRWSERMAGILRTCETARPSLVCLQEALPQLLTLPGWDAWLDRNGYVSSVTDPQALAPYGVLTLARRELNPRFEEVPLPTRMARKLLITHLETGGPGAAQHRWRIGNVHLESLDSAALRAEQLAVAGRALTPPAHTQGEELPWNAVLCGDFNFDSDRNYDVRADQPLENDALAATLPGFADVWSLLHGKSKNKGHTFDSTINALIDRPRPDERMRYDRVMARMAGGGGWRPVAIKLVGTEALGDGGDLFLSDHFGLLTTFAMEEGM